MSHRRLIDQVVENIPSRGPKLLVDLLPSDLYEEVREVKAEFYAGRMPRGLTKTALARTIHKALSDRGHEISSSAVLRWLERAD